MATVTAFHAKVPTVRTSKRKRTSISYLADHYFDETLAVLDDEPSVEEEIDDSDADPEDSAFAIKGRQARTHSKTRPVKKVKKVKKSPAKKEKTQKPFRFLDLEPELRNEIYELALVEPNGLTLVSRTKFSRRSVVRGVISIHESDSYYGKTRRVGGGRWGWYRDGRTSSQTSTEYHKDRKLIPNLLATCQQIRDEASSYLYKQEIVVEDTTALLNFVATIGPYNQKLVNDIVVRGWGEGRGVTRGHNHSALTMLAPCTNLDSLFFDCTVGYYRGDPKKLAGQIYRDGHFFLESYATVNGLDSAVKVVQFNCRQFSKDPSSKEPEFDQTKRDKFEKELERLMKKGSGF